MKDYLTKELEKYEKSRKYRSLESEKRFYNSCEDDDDDVDGYEDCDDIDNYDDMDDYEDDVTNDGYEKVGVKDNDEDTSKISIGNLILNIGGVIVTLAVCILLILSVISWFKDDSNIDSSNMLEINLNDSSVIDNTTSTSNEVESGSGEVDVSSGAVVDHISYKGLEPGKKYYVYVNVYDKNTDKKLKTYKKEFIAESNNKESIDISYHMPIPTNPLQGFYSTYLLSDK